MHNQDSSDLVRIPRAREFFGVSESFLRHAVMDGKIPSYRLGRAVFVSLSEIEKIIRAGEIQ